MRLLTIEEIRELTDYRHPDKQCKALVAMGVRFLRCPRTGRPKVLYEDLRPEVRLNQNKTEPKWELAN
ncbi:DUF4224 domain-containing protein [Microbulbifer sp. 2201CG32-9]|uniref:DUF4224 domain-containing protein n=1 Tax=unclassified Microbulbifer TaxID=2619833 RepID=UPI00345C573E